MVWSTALCSAHVQLNSSNQFTLLSWHEDLYVLCLLQYSFYLYLLLFKLSTDKPSVAGVLIMRQKYESKARCNYLNPMFLVDTKRRSPRSSCLLKLLRDLSNVNLYCFGNRLLYRSLLCACRRVTFYCSLLWDSGPIQCLICNAVVCQSKSWRLVQLVQQIRLRLPQVTRYVVPLYHETRY